MFDIESTFNQLTETNHKTPIFTVTITTQNNEKKDITSLLNERLISLTLTDNRGFEADCLDLEISDHDSAVELPPRNAKIQVFLGFKGESFVDKGEYLADEIQFSGSPDKINIRARSADLKGSLTEQKERSFHNITLEALVTQIAKEHGLEAKISEDLKAKTLTHIDQTTESDSHFLTRIAKEYDAFSTVKNGYLLFLINGTGETASGEELTTWEISKTQGDNYSFSLAETENFKAVKATWHDLKTGKKGTVIIYETDLNKPRPKKSKGRKKKENQKKETIETNISDSTQIKTLRRVYATEQSATNGAYSALRKLKRGGMTFSMTLAEGNPEIIPESPVVLRGFKKLIDEQKWLVSKVTHNLSNQGLTTTIECETKLDD